MISRRRFVSTLGVAGAAAHVDASQTAGRGAAGDEPPRIVVGDRLAVVETKQGRVRGYVDDGIQTFKGIPYGSSPAGPGRFKPPTEPAPWPGIRDALRYGPACPQNQARHAQTRDHIAFLLQQQVELQDEDCLRLNVWTPGPRGRRPVMVWLHGGGFFAGSAAVMAACDGRNLAARGDVVVVSLNHRLHLLGFLDLSFLHERFAASANVGLLDIVCALRWIRDNIAAFGGDPQAVTIFGQSGGGAKVSYLLSMPDAKGLFHRAAILSAIPKLGETRTGQQIAVAGRRLVEALGLGADPAAEMEALALERLQAAATVPTTAQDAYIGPGIDGRVVPRPPFTPGSLVSPVPLLVGNTRDEGSPINTPERESMTEADLRTAAAELYGTHSGPLLDAVATTFPAAKPVERFGYIRSTGGLDMRIQSVAMATTHAASAPAYLYEFAWQTPVLDGRPRAFHRSELPFVFDTTDRCAQMTGGGAAPRALAAQVSAAWIAFARTGRPGHPGLPHWLAVRDGELPTMIFDVETAVRRDHDRDARTAFAAARAASSRTSGD